MTQGKAIIDRNGYTLVPRYNALREQAYSNILKILLPKKNESFQMKNSKIFHISAQNIECGYSSRRF